MKHSCLDTDLMSFSCRKSGIFLAFSGLPFLTVAGTVNAATLTTK